MDITGKTFISKGKYGFYMTVKDKLNDTKAYLNVSFRKGEEPEDGGEFNINKAFLSASTSKTGEVKIKLFVMDYDNPNASPSGKAYPKGVTFEETESNGVLPF